VITEDAGTSPGPSGPGQDSAAAELDRLRALNHELVKERDALRAVIEHAPEASLAHLDRDFNFIFVNAAYARGCRMEKHALLGQNHFEVFPDDENEAVFRQVRDTGIAVEFKAKPFVFEREPERGVTYWDWTLTPLSGPDGSVESLVFSLVDVTAAVRRQNLADAFMVIDAVMHSTLDVDEIVRGVIVETAAATGADSAGVVLRRGEGWVAHHMAGPLGHLSGQVFTDDEASITKRAVESGKTVVAYDTDGDEATATVLREYGVVGIAAAPLIAGGEPYGALLLTSHSRPGRFDAATTEFLERVAASLALAIANARDFELEHRRVALEDALYRIITTFMTARSPDEVLRRVVDESVSAVGADYGVISVVERGEWVVRHAFGEGGIQRLPVTYPYLDRPVIVHAAESRSVQLVPDALTDGYTNKSIMREFGIAAFAAVPLVVRTELLGVLEIVYSRRRAEFDPAEAEFFDRLMVAVAIALEESQVSERERRVSETLQASMLVLPESIGGVAFSHAYRAASEAERVGGDFYDLFEIDEHRVGITVGDVAGKGLNAAALTSLVKNTIRARAVERGAAASQAVALADRVVFKGSGPEMFATVFFGILDRRDGTLSYCSAGHAVVMMVEPNGEVVPLPPNSPIAGAFHNATFRDSETRLRPGDSLFLYTDGLTDARTHGGREMFGEQRLSEVLSRRAASSPADRAQTVLDEVLEFAGGHLRDDVAVLDLTFTGGGVETGAQTSLDVR